MKRLYILILIVVLCVPSITKSQIAEDYFSIFAALSLPTGNFGKDVGDGYRLTRRAGFDIGDDASFANMGFGGGIEITLLTGIRGFGWVTNVMYIMNPSEDSKVTEKFKNIYKDTVDVAFDYGYWINIPVMTGFKYQLFLSPRLDLYSLAQVGINISKAATRKATVSGTLVDESKFDAAKAFGFAFGVGMMLNKRYDISLRYLNFGKPEYSGERYLSSNYFHDVLTRLENDDINGEQRPVSMILLGVGIHF